MPGLDRNALREFLQPLTFISFLGLVCLNWVLVDLVPKWFVYLYIGLLLTIGVLNLNYYSKKRQ